MRVGLTTAFWALVGIASIRSRYAEAERVFRAEENLVVAVDCAVSGWTYGECDATGHQVRTRCVTTAPNALGKACPKLKETVWCSLHSECGDTYKVVANTAVGTRKVAAVIDILAYNDVYEMLQDSVNGLLVGGPSRVVPIAQAMKAKNPNSLVLFAGDTMSPSLWSLQYKGLQMVDAHNAIGVDFASLGNHEFDFGIDGFIEVSKKSNFPWLNANCYEIATKTLLRGTIPRKIKIFDHPVYGKITIGLFGIMYDMQDSTKGLYWTDPIQAAKDQVAALQAAGVDMIIALSHQLAEDDDRLSAQVPGIHVIYGGHDHSLMLQTDYGTPYLKGAFDFRSIWSSHIEYIPKDTVGAATFRMQHKAIPITQDLPSDAALDLVINNYQTTIGQLFSRVVGKICEPGLDLTNAVVRTKDAPIAHIFTDAEVQFYGAGSVDVSIVNGGAIRTSTTYPAGTFTLAQLVAWSPFGNVIMIVETDGASLKKFITREMLGNCGPTGIILNGLYAHPSGVKYAFQCTGNKQGSITSIEWFGHPTRTGPVLDDDVFKLALNEYLFKTEFSVISGVKSKVIKSEAEAMRIEAVLEAYIQKQPDQTLCESGPLRSSVSYAPSP